MEKPLVSVIIPVYNEGKHIEKALESVFKQTFKDIEVIVVDDGSTDNTHQIIIEWQKKYSTIILVQHTKNLGFVDSLNDGVKRASGKYIARLDADDTWTDVKKLEKQVVFLEANPTYVLVGGGIEIVGEKDSKILGRYLFPEKDQEIRDSLLSYNLFAHSSVVFTKDAFLKVGGYDKKFGFFADIDLWLKMGTIGKLYNFQEFFIRYLDKEYDNKNYVSRDDQIRRRFLLRCQMKWSYRKNYPGVFKAILLSFGSYVYSFIPFRSKVKPMLFTLRTKLLGSPYKY